MATIMMAHVLYPDLDDDLPASLSAAVVEGILRKELKYDGVVLTDDLEMKAVAARWKPAESAVLAMKAGCDVLPVCASHDAQVDAMEGAIRALESEEVTLGLDGRLVRARAPHEGAASSCRTATRRRRRRGSRPASANGWPWPRRSPSAAASRSAIHGPRTSDDPRGWRGVQGTAVSWTRPPCPAARRSGRACAHPAGAVDLERLDRGVQTLRSLGFEVVVGDAVRARSRFTAGTIEERVRDLQTLWADDSVAGIVCARGGAGAGWVAGTPGRGGDGRAPQGLHGLQRRHLPPLAAERATAW